METGTSGTGNNACIDVCQRIVNCNYETTGESSVSTTNCGLPKIEGVNVLDFLKQLENWQSIFDILKLLNN